jgi:hypothetical protein
VQVALQHKQQLNHIDSSTFDDSKHCLSRLIRETKPHPNFALSSRKTLRIIVMDHAVDQLVAFKAQTLLWVSQLWSHLMTGLHAGLHFLSAQWAATIAALPSNTQLLYGVLLLVMIVGVIGSVVPALPGASLIVIAIVIWGTVKGFSAVVISLPVAIVVFLLSIGVDFLASIWGAQKAGASHWGQIGALVGLLAGVFGLLPALPVGGPIVGFFVGPFVGAFIGELLYRRKFMPALKAAVGVVVSALIGNVVQGILALATVIVFVVTTWSAVS